MEHNPKSTDARDHSVTSKMQNEEESPAGGSSPKKVTTKNLIVKLKLPSRKLEMSALFKQCPEARRLKKPTTNDAVNIDQSHNTPRPNSHTSGLETRDSDTYDATGRVVQLGGDSGDAGGQGDKDVLMAEQEPINTFLEALQIGEENYSRLDDAEVMGSFGVDDDGMVLDAENTVGSVEEEKKTSAVSAAEGSALGRISGNMGDEVVKKEAKKEDEEMGEDAASSVDSCAAFEPHEEEEDDEEEDEDDHYFDPPAHPTKKAGLDQRTDTNRSNLSTRKTAKARKLSAAATVVHALFDCNEFPQGRTEGKKQSKQKPAMNHKIMHHEQPAVVNMADMGSDVASGFDQPLPISSTNDQETELLQRISELRQKKARLEHENQQMSLHHQMSTSATQPGLSQYSCNPSDQPSKSRSWLGNPHAKPVPQAEARTSPIVEDDVDADGSSEDEPLRTRMMRHQSVLSRASGITSSPPVRVSALGKLGDQANTIKAEPVDDNLDQTESQDKNPVRLQCPLPQPREPSPVVPSSPVSETGIGSWALPKYEVQRQPLEKKDDVPVVKVSLPNLVREELLLSPDHAEQEVHLLLNLFIPGQQALAEPDPQPATALLNFHTIAIMIVEAFIQFEIGDEMSFGPRHLRNSDTVGEVGDPENRRYDAKDANVDEIFFAVIDRWRAGLESKKQGLQLIRGVQEFCDVALDVIYYIKENGLFKPEPKKRARKEKAADGTEKKEIPTKKGKGKEKEETTPTKTKGKKKADMAEEEGEAKKGVKRQATTKVNELQARKKAKPASKPGPKTKAKPKSTGITVLKKR